MTEKSLPKPCGHLVMIHISRLETRSTGGIILSTEGDPNERKRLEDGRQVGIVHSIGQNAWKDMGDGSPWASIGDKVYFKRYAGIEYRDKDDELYRIVNDDDIHAVFPTEEDK